MADRVFRRALRLVSPSRAIVFSRARLYRAVFTIRINEDLCPPVLFIVP